MFGRARVDPAEPETVNEFRRRVVQRLTSVSDPRNVKILDFQSVLQQKSTNSIKVGEKPIKHFRFSI